LQLDLIVDLLGSPSDEDIRSACEPAKAYVRSKGHLSSKIAALYQLSTDCDDFVMHLMCQMLTFNPVFCFFDNSCGCILLYAHLAFSVSHIIYFYSHLFLIVLASTTSCGRYCCQPFVCLFDCCYWHDNSKSYGEIFMKFRE